MHPKKKMIIICLDSDSITQQWRRSVESWGGTDWQGQADQPTQGPEGPSGEGHQGREGASREGVSRVQNENSHLWVWSELNIKS